MDFKHFSPQTKSLEANDESSSDDETCGFVLHISDSEDEVKNKSENKPLNEAPEPSIKTSNLDLKIMERRKRLRDEVSSSEDEEEDETDRLVQKKVNPKRKKMQEDVDSQEKKEAGVVKYGEVVKNIEDIESFDKIFGLQMELRRALYKLKWFKPTPIQAATIPEVLYSRKDMRDICACASTGTGKTGAVMIPLVARALLKVSTGVPGLHGTTLVLTPTRELAVQFAEVTKNLTEFTKDVTHTLLAGGHKKKSEEESLMKRPDIIIATPGKLIYHLNNTPNFNLSKIGILVIDEADKMLDEDFADQLKEVIEKCPKEREIILLSATMTEKVEDLAMLSLRDPVKIFINEIQEETMSLKQEYINIRPQHESKRESVVAALVMRTFKTRCIIFVKTKKEAHRLRILLGLLGAKVGEIHGNLSQNERLESLKNFKEGSINILVATDVLGRGIDILDVKTVINVTMPQSVAAYTHRVGRTARAEKKGRAITLVSETEWNMLKQLKKRSDKSFKQRIIAPGVLEKYNNKITELESLVDEIEAEEAAEKESNNTGPKCNATKKKKVPTATLR